MHPLQETQRKFFSITLFRQIQTSSLINKRKNSSLIEINLDSQGAFKLALGGTAVYFAC